MENNISNDQVYQTSFYGRFGYFVMTIIFLIATPICLGVGYENLLHPDPWSEIFAGIFFTVIGLGGVYAIIRNLYFIIYFGKRFVLKNDQLEYYGFFRRIKIQWNDIKEVSTNHSMQAYVLLAITTHSNKRGYSMDISGLKPTYSSLLEEIEKRRNGIFGQVDAPQNTTRRTKLLFITTIVVVVMFVAFKFYSNAQQNAKYEAEDARERQSAPDLQIELKSLTNKEQSEVIKEYREQGLNLRCFSDLRPEEKITKQDDYLCWAVTKSILNIPSKSMAIFFSKKKLTNVRLEFPESSFNLVQSYLNTTLGEQPRLDLIPGDTIDSSIMSWKVDNGIVNTNNTNDDKILITWSSEKVLSPNVRKEFKNIQ